MAKSPTSYHAIPAFGDHFPDIHEVGASSSTVHSDNLYPSRERILSVAPATWAYFLLGGATLLPWNGGISRPIIHSSVDPRLSAQR